LILEKYRPRTLDDYIGNTDALHSLASFARGNIKDAEAILLFGQPGVGKTTLALAFCRTNGFTPLEVNASDTRRKKDAQSLSRAAVGSTLTRSGPPKKRVLIIDECEGATAFLNNIMNDQHMKILICNEVMKIPYHIRERLHIVEVKRPKIGDYTKLLKRLSIEPETYKDVIKKVSLVARLPQLDRGWGPIWSNYPERYPAGPDDFHRKKDQSRAETIHRFAEASQLLFVQWRRSRCGS